MQPVQRRLRVHVIVLLLGWGCALPVRAVTMATATPASIVCTPTPTSPAARLRHAIEHAAAFLGRHEHGAEAAWIITQGAIALGPKFKAWAGKLKVDPAVSAAATPNSQPDFTGAIDARMFALRWRAPRSVPKLKKPALVETDRAGARSFDLQELGSLAELLLLSAYCPTLKADQKTRLLQDLSRPTHGYALTKQLLGLMLAYNQGCLTTAVAEPLRARLATQLFQEAVADGDILDALTLERLAMLCYARVCDWVDPQLITRLVGEQDTFGGWGPRDPRIFRGFVARESHTAALAFYVLAQTWAAGSASPPAPKPPIAK